MSWVLSMAVVEGLSAEQIAGRLEAELGEEATGDSPSGEEAGPGPGLPAVGIHGDGRAVIHDDRDADAPVLEDARLLARLSHGTRVVLFELSERVNCGLFRVGCWVDGAMAWQITHCREEPETEEYQILGIPPGDLCRHGGAVSRPAGPGGCRRGGHLLSGAGRGSAVCLAHWHPLRPGWLVVGPAVSGPQAHRSSLRLS